MFEQILNGLTYSYSNLEDDKNLKFWTDYYTNNHTAIESYYKGIEPTKIEDIKESAKNTADGFFHILRVDETGNTETQHKCEKPQVIKGVAFIMNTSNPDGVTPENILMSVGVFTTKLATFYIMVGICTGYSYTGEKIKGLSVLLSGYVAKIINSPRFTDEGNQKNSFITRPLQVMGKLFESPDSTELNIPYDESLSLPEPSDSTYISVKKEIVQKGAIRQQNALNWLKQCKQSLTDDAATRECIGDLCFFYHFVLDIFSPKWGYTGKRIEKLVKSFKGGNKYSKKYNKQKIRKHSHKNCKSIKNRKSNRSSNKRR
jgi:hypothetical protein